MTQEEIRKLICLDGQCGYHEENKKEYRRLSMKLLRALAAELRLAKTDADLRYNRGGVAVAGDAALHSDHLYVTLNMDGMGLGVLVRTCEGRRDSTGGPNRWFSLDELERTGVAGLATFARQVLREGQRIKEVHHGRPAA